MVQTAAIPTRSGISPMYQRMNEPASHCNMELDRIEANMDKERDRRIREILPQHVAALSGD